MVQILIRKMELERPLVIEDIIVLEDLPVSEEDYGIVPVKGGEKPDKKALLKLLKKAKYNAKYLEEKIPVEKIRRNIHYRNHIVY